MSWTNLQRVGGTLFLTIFMAYQIASFGEYRNWFKPRLRHSVADIFWPNVWKMFTQKAKQHTGTLFEGRKYGEAWVELPMHTWYPARWESGYRWERPPVRRSGQIQEQFLHLACQKSGMDQTRMTLHRWPKSVGQYKQPRRRVRMADLKTWNCSDTPRAPKGRVL